MNYIIMSLLALLAGSAIALQSSMSGQLSKILSNPFFATFVIYLSSLLFTSLILLFSSTQLPTLQMLQTVPKHLWYVGGILSVLGVTAIYWLIPQLGVAGVLSFVLAGQIFISMLTSHFGWFELPVTPLDTSRVIGAIMMVAGVMLINSRATQ